MLPVARRWAIRACEVAGGREGVLEVMRETGTGIGWSEEAVFAAEVDDIVG